MMNMKVTIFGLAGTGKTSVGEAVAQGLGWEFMSNGNLFRDLARERGMVLNEFEKLAEGRHEIDREVDKRTEEYGKTHDNFVYEARLAWHFIPDSIKIKLSATDDERLRRISGRDNISLEEACRQTIDREESIRLRYKDIYEITDFSNDEHFDFVLDTTTLNLPAVILAVREYIVSHPEYV